MLFMQDFISKISAKNVFVIIKTYSASEGSGLIRPNYPPAFQFPRVIGVQKKHCLKGRFF